MSLNTIELPKEAQDAAWRCHPGEQGVKCEAGYGESCSAGNRAREETGMSLSVTELAKSVDTSDGFSSPVIGTLANGDYVIAYAHNTGIAPTDDLLFAQIFDAEGESVAAGTFSDNGFTPDSLAVGALSGGGFALAWDRDSFPNSDIGTAASSAGASELSSTVGLNLSPFNENF